MYVYNVCLKNVIKKNEITTYTTNNMHHISNRSILLTLAKIEIIYSKNVRAKVAIDFA